MTDQEIEAAAKEGDLIHLLQTGTSEEAAALLRQIAEAEGQARANELKRNYRPDGIPLGLLKCRRCGWWHTPNDTCGDCENPQGGEEWKNG